MRTVKFRAWDTVIKEYRPVNEVFCLNKDGIVCNMYLHLIILEQFTGLFDKHGVEIYERDIVRPIMINGSITDGVVMFIRGAFYAKQIGDEGMVEYLDLLRPEELEVIGNNHEENY